MPYRLGIDLGINSLGWCALKLGEDGRPNGVLDMGVRLFTDGRDPKTGTSLAADRRIARQMRRRRDRYLKRRARLMDLLVRHGLMPAGVADRKAIETLDPYALRAKGLHERLEPHELGRALFHLNQRRGFRSSRKTDKGGDDQERGKIDLGVRRLKEALAETGSWTIGEYLHQRHVRREAVRVRPVGKGAKAEYPFYPLRVLVEEEFDRLWTEQAKYHPALLTDAAKTGIRRAIFHQRPLKPVDPGRCTVDPSDERAPWGLPLAQRFRILKELNNLRIVARDQSERSLTKEERDRLYSKLRSREKLTFEQMRRELKLDSGFTFNLESDKRTFLKGDAVGRVLADKTRFGKDWWSFDDAKQDAIAEVILAAEDEDALAAIARAEWGLNDDQASAVARTSLPDGYCRLGRRALAKIVPIMLEQGLDEYHAAKEAGYEPSDFRGDGTADTLPYYGVPLERHMIGASGRSEDEDEKRYGRFPNPTVHIGLNQLRVLVNALIATYGKPHEIVIELARDLKLNRKQKEEIERRIKEDTDRNEKLRAELTELGQKINRENLQRLKLYHELKPQDRVCIYTGERISAEMLFGPEVAIDHILPFKDTLDDSLANKVLCLRRANHDKGKRSPYEAFHAHPGYKWDEILLRAEALPPNKRRRFSADALGGSGEFIARALNDTAYVAKIAKEYLGQICPSDRVWAIPGKLTSLLRGRWALNGILSDSNLKNRADHRHHAIDAFVVGCTDRGLLKRMSDAAAAARLDRALEDLPAPWEGFDRDDFRERVRAIVVSLRPDHGRQARLHEETAYGLVASPEAEGGATVVYRKPFADLNENEIERIRDPLLRGRIKAHLESARQGKESLSKTELAAALAAFAAEDPQFSGIRHVRLLKREDPTTLIRLRNAHGAAYKALMPGENYCLDVYEQPDGSWYVVPVTVYEANQPAAISAKLNRLRAERKIHPTARKVMRIHKGDYLKLEHDGVERVMRVVRLEPANGRLRAADHNESGELQKRHDDKDDSFRWAFIAFSQLRKRGARRVWVDPLGRVRDPGPPPSHTTAVE
jgi:CRISPR-associated endonuclease Csn1